MKKYSFVLLALGMFVVAATAPSLAAHTSSVARTSSLVVSVAPKARLTMAQAEAKALAVHHGQIVKKELEKEKGGSGLRYTFDIVVHGVTYEVGIDAVTGKVLQNINEANDKD